MIAKRAFTQQTSNKAYLDELGILWSPEKIPNINTEVGKESNDEDSEGKGHNKRDSALGVVCRGAGKRMQELDNRLAELVDLLAPLR
jgi:hypothetical protein